MTFSAFIIMLTVGNSYLSGYKLSIVCSKRSINTKKLFGKLNVHDSEYTLSYIYDQGFRRMGRCRRHTHRDILLASGQ
jgi:hypothetical protein